MELDNQKKYLFILNVHVNATCGLNITQNLRDISRIGLMLCGLRKGQTAQIQHTGYG